MNREIVIYIDGHKADTYCNDSVTLDFNSSILSDVSSIKCSGSKTIRLPKTTANDAIFDLPHMPSHESSKAHKVLSCSMSVDGISIFGNGLCHLLDSDGDHYEVAVTFGVMHGLESWLKNKPKLRDLQQSESDFVPWKYSDNGWYGGESQDELMKYMPSMWYANYDCGVSDTSKINIHPCVTLREIYARVKGQNALPLDMPQNVVEDMGNRAVVLKNNNTSLLTLTESVRIKANVSVVTYGKMAHKLYFDISSDCFDMSTSTFVQKGYKQVVIYLPAIRLTMSSEMIDTSSIYFEQSALDFFNTSDNCRLVLEYSNGTKDIITPTKNEKYFYWRGRTLTFDYYEGEDVGGLPLVKMYVEIYRWSSVPNDVWENPNNDRYTLSWSSSMRSAFKFTAYNGIVSDEFAISYQENNNGYPMDRFTFSENLPDITQIDFINFISKFYGMFPMQDGDSVAFVPFSRLFDNIAAGNVYDWSKVLTERYLDCPNNVSQTIDGYAQRNTIKYKEDKNDPVDIAASLVVEDEALESEKKLIEFPFAASRGNKIPQYSLNDEGELEKNDCEYRVMRITYGENYENNALRFTDDMTPQQIANRHYSELQDVIRKPMQIEEEVMLSLLDLQTIDYSKPVYLAKYGRYFAIISIQWTSNQQTSRVKLLRIK